MKNRKRLIKILFCVGMVAVELLLYFGVSKHIAKSKAEEARYFRTENEFLRTIDCAEIFDAYPGHAFELTFEIRAEKPGEILVYQQNGSGVKYSFKKRIAVTEEFSPVSLIVEPVLVNEDAKRSHLSFYGEYGSGVIPTVRDISIVPLYEAR